MNESAPSLEKVSEGKYEPGFALQYCPLSKVDTFYPDEDEKYITVGISEKDGSELKLIGQSSIRKIEVRYGWDKAKGETSSVPAKRMKVRFYTSKLLVKDIHGFVESLKDLIEEDPELFEDIIRRYQDLLKCQEIDEPGTQGKKPFSCVVRYLSQSDQHEIINRTVRPRGDYNPGTDPGHEGANDEKYSKAMARRVVKSISGLYDADGNELFYNSEDDHPNLDVLYEFVERNQGLMGDLNDFAKNMRSQVRKQKKIVSKPKSF